MPTSLFKHITKRKRPCKEPWQARVFGEYLGSFANEEQAAKVVAKKLGKPKASLLRTRGADRLKAPERTHKYIYWHKKEQAWQVQIKGEYVGVFWNHEDALKKVIKKTGLKAKSLLLCPDTVRRSLQGQRGAVLQDAVWFQELYAAYSDADKVSYPGDLCDMHDRAAQGSCILEHPNFIVMMMLAKFGPHRDALHNAFVNTPKPKNDPWAVKWTYKVIKAALVSLSKMDLEVMDPWIAGPGKKSTHHSGLVVYSNVSLKIIKAVDEDPNAMSHNKATNGSRCLVFGKERRRFMIQPYSAELEQILLKVRAFGQCLLKAEPPTSLEQWSQAMLDMTSAIKTAPGIPKSTCYRYKWIVRGFWDYRRQAVGIEPGITFSKHATVLSGNKNIIHIIYSMIITRIIIQLPNP